MHLSDKKEEGKDPARKPKSVKKEKSALRKEEAELLKRQMEVMKAEDKLIRKQMAREPGGHARARSGGVTLEKQQTLNSSTLRDNDDADEETLDFAMLAAAFDAETT